MAPAGSFESLQAALDKGADSVYFGVEQLNMRARSSINFTLDDLQEISQRCKEKLSIPRLDAYSISAWHRLPVSTVTIKSAPMSRTLSTAPMVMP